MDKTFGAKERIFLFAYVKQLPLRPRCKKVCPLFPAGLLPTPIKFFARGLIMTATSGKFTYIGMEFVKDRAELEFGERGHEG